MPSFHTSLVASQSDATLGTPCLTIWITVDQLAKETIGQGKDPLASVHCEDLKPLVNSYIQQLVEIKYDVAVYGRYLYLSNTRATEKFQHLTRNEEVVIIRLRIGHTKATKAHILSRGPPTTCHHCGQMLTIDHVLLVYAVFQARRDEYYPAELNTLWRQFPRLE